MASRKVRLKIDAGDDLADHKVEPQPSLKPVITRPRPPADALPLPPDAPSAPSAPRALPPVRAPLGKPVRPPPIQKPVLPPPAPEVRRSPVSPLADALRNVWSVVVDTPRSLLRRAAARRSGTAASWTEPPRGDALPEFTADVTSTSVPAPLARPKARRTRPRPVRKTPPNPAAAAPALSASVEAAAADAAATPVETPPASSAPRRGFAGRFQEFLQRRASPVKSPGNVPPSPIFAWIPRFTRYSRRYDADGPAAPDAAEEVKEERSE